MIVFPKSVKFNLHPFLLSIEMLHNRNIYYLNALQFKYIKYKFRKVFLSKRNTFFYM